MPDSISSSRFASKLCVVRTPRSLRGGKICQNYNTITALPFTMFSSSLKSRNSLFLRHFQKISSPLMNHRHNRGLQHSSAAVSSLSSHQSLSPFLRCHQSPNSAPASTLRGYHMMHMNQGGIDGIMNRNLKINSAGNFAPPMQIRIQNNGSTTLVNIRNFHSMRRNQNGIQNGVSGPAAGRQQDEWTVQVVASKEGTHVYMVKKTHPTIRYKIPVQQNNTTVLFIVILVVLLAFLFSTEKAPKYEEVFGTKTDVEVEDLLHWQVTEETPSDQFYDQTYTHVKTLTCANGTVVYLIGTNHASKLCGKDVDYLVDQMKPNAVMVELCPSRTSFLKDTASGIGYDIRAGYQAAQRLDIPCILSDQDSFITQDQFIMEQIRLTLESQQDDPESLAKNPNYDIYTSVTPEAFDSVIRSERDVYLARSILAASAFPGVKSIVCQVGLAHMPGIVQYLTTMDSSAAQKLTDEFEHTWSLRLQNVKFRELSYNLFFIENKSIGEPQRLLKIRDQLQARLDASSTPAERDRYTKQLEVIEGEIQSVRNSHRGS